MSHQVRLYFSFRAGVDRQPIKAESEDFAGFRKLKQRSELA